MANTLEISGDCRKPQYVWDLRGATCELGTYNCAAHHIVKKASSRCTYCKTAGGHYTCPESDRGRFCCSNYAGRIHA